MTELPDLNALRRNDNAAWDQLHNWLSPEAFKQAMLQLSGYPAQDVEEVAGEAIYRLVDQVKEVPRVEDLLPLVKAIAKDLAIDHRRKANAIKRGKSLELSLDQLQEQSGDANDPPSPDRPDEEVQRRERFSNLEKVLKKLKPPLMELLVGFYILGLSYDDLARNHHLAIGSVGVYLNRGMQALRAEIHEEPGMVDALRILIALPAQVILFLLNHS